MLLKFDVADKSWVIQEISEEEAAELMHIGKNVFLQHMAHQMFAQLAEQQVEGLGDIPKEEMFNA